MDPDTIEPVIETILAANPGGLDEQALLQALRANPEAGLPSDRPAAGLGLFRAHFVLFHTLYRLRDRLRENGTGDLRIDPFCIELLPYGAGPAALGPYDYLRAYYLDLDNLAATGEADVARLLAGFYTQLRRRTHRAEALAQLELPDSADDAEIRRQYRRLVMRHHPDRGGDAERLQALNRALEVLLPKTS